MNTSAKQREQFLTFQIEMKDKEKSEYCHILISY